jgi:hypothetical protein
MARRRTSRLVPTGRSDHPGLLPTVLEAIDALKLEQAMGEAVRRCNTAAVTGIVFDDPVSSLDHMRREQIARRLAREAKVRQVNVFTHDLAFA